MNIRPSLFPVKSFSNSKKSKSRLFSAADGSKVWTSSKVLLISVHLISWIQFTFALDNIGYKCLVASVLYKSQISVLIYGKQKTNR